VLLSLLLYSSIFLTQRQPEWDAHGNWYGEEPGKVDPIEDDAAHPLHGVTFPDPPPVERVLLPRPSGVAS